MSNGDEAADTAATRLRDLHEHFREHPVTGPSAGRRPNPTSSAPLNVGMLDHIRASVDEVVAHTRAINPEAGPVPTRVEHAYDWCREHTEHADEDQRFRLEVLEVRHRLEHAVRAGDGSVVRPLRCPECRTVGLYWQAPMWRAVCVNRHCARAAGGVSRSYTLGRLAHEIVTARKNLRQARAT